jgi:hypothetical protein
MSILRSIELNVSGSIQANVIIKYGSICYAIDIFSHQFLILKVGELQKFDFELIL